VADVLPHDKQDTGANQTVFDGAGIQVGTRIVEHLAHDVRLIRMPIIRLASHVRQRAVAMGVNTGGVDMVVILQDFVGVGRDFFDTAALIEVHLVLLCVLELVDGQLGFSNKRPKPNADVGGHHVHQAELGHILELVDRHLRIVEDEVELQDARIKRIIFLAEYTNYSHPKVC
jgi:hypothetical protein